MTNSANSFGDGTIGLIITAGTVTLQNSGAAGSAHQQIQISNYGELQAAGSGTMTLTNPVAVGQASFAGSPLVLSGGVTQASHGEMDVANTTTVVNYVDNLISAPGEVEGKTGPGTLILSGTASGTANGIFSLDCGTLGIDSDAPLPAGMTLQMTAGVMKAVNQPHTVSNPLSILGDINFLGSQPLTFGAATGNAFGGNESQSTRGIFVDASAPVTINNLVGHLQESLVVGGSGTLILAGHPSGLVATRVVGGRLCVSNTNGTGSLGPITVNSGGALGGNGVIAQNEVTVSSGGAIDPGMQVGLTGTLTLGAGLLLNTGAALTFDLGATSGNDLVAIFGTLSMNGIATVNLRDSGNFGSGVYTLMTWSSAPGITSANFTLGTAPVGYRCNLYVSGQSLLLDVSTTPYGVTVGVSPSAGGTITGAGSYAPGSTATLAATPTSGYAFVSWTFNGSVVATTNVYTFSVTNNDSFLANFTRVSETFAQWQGAYFNTAQLNDPSYSGAAATPFHDGVPNLLKYVFNIAPSAAMSASDRAALPAEDIVTTSGTTYLTLTYHQNFSATGVTITAQSSTDLAAWEAVTSHEISGTLNGDYIVQAEVPLSGSTRKQFLRINITMP